MIYNTSRDRAEQAAGEVVDFLEGCARRFSRAGDYARRAAARRAAAVIRERGKSLITEGDDGEDP